MADYINFIHSDILQKRKASDIVNPANFGESIFASDSEIFDRANKNNLNSTILKSVLRIYLTGTQMTDAPVNNLKR